ncbi:hypothetical protein QBC41DRAFT_297491 [Cercophora samala]|uniref:RING-type domain-containing protein n=1 Tax=Cercophora samala TaxID=330535 RepID=A0AA39ZNI3_9PEZI|nr:hypothetical protein QBC41DRAFT_297491 [Cercophora samala]
MAQSTDITSSSATTTTLNHRLKTELRGVVHLASTIAKNTTDLSSPEIKLLICLSGRIKSKILSLPRSFSTTTTTTTTTDPAVLATIDTVCANRTIVETINLLPFENDGYDNSLARHMLDLLHDNAPLPLSGGDHNKNNNTTNNNTNDDNNNNNNNNNKKPPPLNRQLHHLSILQNSLWYCQKFFTIESLGMGTKRWGAEEQVRIREALAGQKRSIERLFLLVVVEVLRQCGEAKGGEPKPLDMRAVFDEFSNLEEGGAKKFVRVVERFWRLTVLGGCEVTRAGRDERLALGLPLGEKEKEEEGGEEGVCNNCVNDAGGEEEAKHNHGFFVRGVVEKIWGGFKMGARCRCNVLWIYAQVFSVHDGLVGEGFVKMPRGEGEVKQEGKEEQEETESCPICIEDLFKQRFSPVLELPCRHQFHLKCELQWLAGYE